jgi:glycosyltransferase involved in cell wall biosynthesis
MKIGINASFLRKPATGIGQVTTHFLNELIRQIREEKKYKNYKFFLYLEEDIDLDLPKNFHKRIFLPPYKRDDLIRKIWWEKFGLPHQACRDKCDILFSLYQSATVIKYTCMKHIVLVHDIIPTLLPEYLNNFRKKIYQHEMDNAVYGATKILTVSECSRQDLIEKMNVKAEKIVTNLIAIDPLYLQEISKDDIQRVLKKYNLEKDYLYYGGGLEVRKNADGVLRAYKKLKERQLDVPPLVISGKLMPELAPLVVDVEKIVQELELQDSVKILGYVEQQDLPALYSSALFFIFPSHYEGFGMPVLEAMQMGVPVITARTSSLEEVGGEAVLYVDNNSDEDIMLKMEQLLSDKNLRDELVEKAKIKAQEFSWQNFVNNFFQEVERM